MKHEKSCGGIIIRNDGKFLIIQNKGGNHWDLPKGHVEEGETEEETAKREILEEVNITVEFIPGFKESISYEIPYSDTKKIVVFFLCKAINEEVTIQDEEIKNYKWLSYEEAVDKVTHDNAKELLKKANEFLKKNI